MITALFVLCEVLLGKTSSTLGSVPLQLSWPLPSLLTHFLCLLLYALGSFGGILPAAEPARVRPPGLRVLLGRGAMSHFLESFKEHG